MKQSRPFPLQIGEESNVTKPAGEMVDVTKHYIVVLDVSCVCYDLVVFIQGNIETVLRTCDLSYFRKSSSGVFLYVLFLIITTTIVSSGFPIITGAKSVERLS